MDKYIPDIYQQSIYTIDYQKLKDCGIKCLLFDLDNTLVPAKIDEPTKKVNELFKELKKDFKVIIFSNSHKRRVSTFSEKLKVDFYHSACKPFTKNFKKVITNNDYNISEVAIIGDQVLTDIIGGNKVGITTILINPVSPIDSFFTKINRHIEKIIINKLTSRNLFFKGHYYE
ncbi:MAG: YqeG family HAD IIIA-type phosphatase [Bacilli bacterium]|nr:YqeG family HAD IIIA-type phosphatase [Bacilli bacterium]